MANEIEVIVAYDTADSKARDRLFEALKDQGLLPIQKSVFWGRVLPSELRLIQNLLGQHITDVNGRAFVVTGKGMAREILRLGVGYNDDLFEVKEFSVV